MRKAINDNPVVQIGLLAALALLVGFLLLTRMGHKSTETSSTTTPTASSSASVAPATSSDSSAAAPSPAPAPAAAAPSGAASGKFVAGPGLPAPVVNAYKADRVVVLLVVRRNGIDDDAVKRSAQELAGPGPVALFVTNAGHIARYSRIATGVDLDRVPALIVLRPRNLAKGTPTALVKYGFRGPHSIVQAVRDATYKGPTNVPYYPR